jgi:hypothetical protein
MADGHTSNGAEYGVLTATSGIGLAPIGKLHFDKQRVNNETSINWGPADIWSGPDAIPIARMT